MSAFFLPFFPFTNSCPSRPGHVWFLFPLTTNWPLLANWFPPHNQLPGPFSPPQPTCLIAHYGQVTFPLHNQWACHFSPPQPIAYCFPVSFPPHNQLPVIAVATKKVAIAAQPASFRCHFSLHTNNCLLFPSLFPPSQPIACRCRCNKKVAFAAQSASCRRHFSPTQPIAYCFPVSSHPSSQLIACRCRCNSQVAIAARPASCLLTIAMGQCGACHLA